MAASWGAQLIGGMNSNGQNVGGTATGPLVDCPGGLCVFAVVAAAWGGATVKLQMLGPDGQTLIDVSPTSANLTANGNAAVYLPPCQIQATVVGGPPTGVFASIARVVQ